MADSFDFGFTAVDQDELTTKTGESAALNEKIAEDLKKVAESSKGAVNSEQIENLDAKVDVLNKLVSNALDELDEAKTTMFSRFPPENTRPPAPLPLAGFAPLACACRCRMLLSPALFICRIRP